ncbi:histidine phosphatase family protein [Cellulomonas fimi]|uniref:histidine phosphatase family protein n=1 Tax=Cellulomonas fimi TaxID=1708 RepID=UPI00234D6F6A|nr:histidine phosphatase family protein [Cellulomonas fimi]MDC7121206.1 histidine phosphatase family protein [Cellulomonas fimi]
MEPWTEPHRDPARLSPHDGDLARGVTELMLVRHGESVGNVAAAAAERARQEVIDLDTRDADTPLSALGAEQATALGAWLADASSAASGPDVVWVSPYVRAVQTATIALRAAGLDLPVHHDERLRDRELGILDLLTSAGVDARFPAEAARRRHLGKFFYRPPGGESWADLTLRVRSFLTDLDRWEADRRVLVVAHDAVLMTVRYVCERMTETEVLELGRRNPVRNAAVTRLVRPPGHRPGPPRWELTAFNDDAHLHAQGTPATTHQGDTDAHPH